MDWADYLIGFVLVGGVGASMGLLFLPKKGPQHAYRNWGRLRVLYLCLIGMVMVVGGILALAYLTPDDFPEIWAKVILAGIMLFLMIFVYAFGQWQGPPTGRKGWLRKHYPRVAAAIQRYMRKGDELELYFPALIIDGEPYFMIYYGEAGNPDRVTGLLLLDETGQPINDRDLAERAVRCKHLATQTIHYQRHRERVQYLGDAHRAVNGLQEIFALLEEQKRLFASKGPRVEEDWKQVVEAKEGSLTAIQESIDKMMMEAEWAASHGLGRLTEVSFDEVARLEETIRVSRNPSAEKVRMLAHAVKPAQRLARVVSNPIGWPKGRKLAEGLLAIADLSQLAQEQQKFVLGVFSDEYWSAWRERTAWALQQQAGTQEVPA
jgi:hypothetical protein